MLDRQETEQKLGAVIRYLRQLDVTVSQSNDDTVAIARLRDQHIVINIRNRDLLSCIFTIAHLFGHLVQFLDSDKYAHLTKRVEAPKPMAVDEEFRTAFYEYEVEAFRLGKGLMMSCFEVSREIDSKYTLFLETDFAHFWHFITTGEKDDLSTFNQMLVEAYGQWRGNRRFLTPLPHPRVIRLHRSALSDVV